MQRIGLMGLVRLDMPGGSVFLSEGGFLVWGGDTYTARHATYGTIGSVASLVEGVDEQVPALKITLLPPGTVAPATLSQPGDQTSRVRMYIAEFDSETGLVVGTPNLMFDGQVDRTRLTVGKDRRELEIEVVSTAERLFERNMGSPLSPCFHKSLFATETGEDNATGLTRNIAWGVESPNSSGAFSGFGGGEGYGGGDGYGGGGFGGVIPNARAQIVYPV